jgi:two-component system, chemotaxis family, protein-glutamate methylesterase/glutaminase
MNEGRPHRNLVVVGASAGGVEALQRLAGGLPRDFPAAILVVLHVPATAYSALPAILNRAGPVRARHAEDGDTLEPGQILVAPPDHHLIVYDGAVTLSRGPQENGHRPAVDVLFRSAARAKGSNVVGVVLSGALDDGAAGMVAVAQRGGGCLVQSFEDALYDSMPRAAMAATPSAVPVSMADMPTVLTELLYESTEPQASPPSELMKQEAAMADLDPQTMHEPDRPGTPSGFGCPECHGALFEITEGPLTRYRCRVGHAWSPESLVARQTIDLESALWMALRSLEERAALSRDLSGRASGRGYDLTGDRFTSGADEALKAAEVLRDLIARLGAADRSQLA